MDEESLQQRRVERAGERRRQGRRRRVTAAGALLAVVVAAVVAVVSSTGSPSHTQPAADASGGAAIDFRQAGATAAHHSDARGSSSAGTASGLAPGTGRPGHATVPVLMYHVIAPAPPGAPFPGLYVNPSQFAAQMQALEAAGWHPVTLDQLRANWRDGARLPAGKPIVLTFDNGYHSQYTAALPVLKRLGWVADENIQLSGLPPSQGGLSPAQVRALVDAGWELDTQGISHADLITLDASQLHYQTATARQRLQHRYHVPVNWFAYPSGHYDATVVAALKAAGFAGSTTVVPGWAGPATDPYRLPRVRVSGGTTPSALLQAIASTRAGSAPPGSYG